MPINNDLRRIILGVSNILVIIFSLLLIVYLSYETFQKIPFLEDSTYMSFQLLVCVVFLIDFTVELIFSTNKWKYFVRNMFFLFISIPYLNIIITFNIEFTPYQLYYIRFIPLIRAAFALAIVVGYVSNNKVSSLFASYLAILLSIVYFSSLIFYERETPVNPQVSDYGDAIWWAAMNVTTVGSFIEPVTNIGRVLCVVLACCGMMMFPLFTIYVTNFIQEQNKRDKEALMKMKGLLDPALHKKHKSDEKDTK